MDDDADDEEHALGGHRVPTAELVSRGGAEQRADEGADGEERDDETLAAD